MPGPARPLAVTGAVLDGRPVTVRCAGGKIVEIGADVAVAAGDEVIDAGGMALVPGLVNGHTHAAMTLFRGYGDDLPLMQWLRSRIWPAEAKLSADDVYWGTRLACLEMVRSGTVALWDMYWHGAAVGRAVADSGLKATVGAVFFDGLDPATSGETRAEALRTVDELADIPGVRPSFAPHAIYTVSEASLRWLAEVAAERNLAVQIHLSETEGEVTECLDRYGVRPAELLDRVGLLAPGTVLAHGCWLDQDELELIGERGATIVTNPVSNLKLAVGRVFAYQAAVAAGVAVGLGTDGAASNNNLDLFEELKFFALLQKHETGDPSVLPAAEALRVAAGDASALLRTGAAPPLTTGAAADFLLVRPDAPELAPGDLVANLVYAATGSVVDTTVVAGRVLMRGREVPGEAEVVARARECATRLTAA